jgi:hypothetical protein
MSGGKISDIFHKLGAMIWQTASWQVARNVSAGVRGYWLKQPRITRCVRVVCIVCDSVAPPHTTASDSCVTHTHVAHHMSQMYLYVFGKVCILPHLFRKRRADR